MSQTTLETRRASKLAAIVSLSYGERGAPTITRYTSWTSDLTISGNTWTSCPVLDIEIPDQHGGTESKTGKLTLPVTASPFDRLCTGYGHSIVWVAIEQVDPSDAAATRRQLFFGSVSEVRKNPGKKKRKGLCLATISDIKKAINGVKLSLPMTTTCCVPFGGDHCRVDASSWEQTGTVSSLGSPQRNSATLVLPGVGLPATQLPDDRFAKGTLYVAGRSFRIARSREDLTFDLDEIPPPWIVGEPCKVYPGCRKRELDCGVWNNKPRFMGLGIDIPPRNPVYEEG